MKRSVRPYSSSQCGLRLSRELVLQRGAPVQEVEILARAIRGPGRRAVGRDALEPGDRFVDAAELLEAA